MSTKHMLDPCWILDANPHAEGVELWLISKHGKCVRVVYPFLPKFYAVLHPTKKRSFDFSSLSQEYAYYAKTMAEHDDIKKIEVVKRRIHARDSFYSPCLAITPTSPLKFSRVIKYFYKFDYFDLYNVDVPVVQLFFYESHFFPFAKCQLEFEIRKLKDTRKIVLKALNLRDSNEDIEYELPPLGIVWLEIFTNSSHIVRRPSDPIRECRLTIDPDSKHFDLHQFFSNDMIMHDSHGKLQLRIAESTEYETLRELERAIKMLDPDIIFTAKGDERVFPHLVNRLRVLKMDQHYSLSRHRVPISHGLLSFDGASSYMSYGQILHRSKTQFYLHGRLHIDSAIMGGLHFSDGNLYGIVEIARISYVTLQRLTRITIGGALQSMQFFHAYKQGILIPEEKRNVEHFRNASTLLFSDRGGHILNPYVGLFRRVAELDFTSMYPSLMVKYNVSPEKINCKCCAQDERAKVPGLPYHLCQKQKGIIPLSLELPLKKRIVYKKYINDDDPEKSKRYQQMQSALKWILVVCFGYLGFKNARFGRIEAHQTVCAYSREFLLKAMEIVERHNLIFIHGIVDSLYVQAPPEMKLNEFHRQCAKVVREIEAVTYIPIEYDPNENYFQFITFLPTKAQPKIGALNRYWGVKASGKIKVRGIELRRHDSPPLIKKFQETLISSIAHAPPNLSWDELFLQHMIPILFQFFRYLDARQVSVDELAITVRLTRNLAEYKVKNYQNIAAQHLADHGLYIGPGEKISFIITNDRAENPLERAYPVQLYRKHYKSFDVMKYRELLVRAMNNLLPKALSNDEKKLLVKYGKRYKSQDLGAFNSIIKSL